MRETILIIVALSAFAVVHSLLTAHMAKEQAARLFGAAAVKGVYRLFFTLVSVVTTAAAFAFVFSLPDRVLVPLPPELRIVLRIVQIAALGFGALAFRVTPPLEFLGVSQAWRYLSGRVAEGDSEGVRQTPIVRTGVYGLVRHPLYLAAIVILLCSPEFTRNWIAIRVICIAYILIGTSFEERRLLRERGEEYRLYQAEVPRLFPGFRTLFRFHK